MNVFQYVVFYLPHEDETDDKARIIVDPATILAKDERQAMMLAARAVPEYFIDKLDQVEIAVRPF